MFPGFHKPGIYSSYIILISEICFYKSTVFSLAQLSENDANIQPHTLIYKRKSVHKRIKIPTMKLMKKYKIKIWLT